MTPVQKLKWLRKFYEGTPLKMGGLPCCATALDDETTVAKGAKHNDAVACAKSGKLSFACSARRPRISKEAISQAS